MSNFKELLAQSVQSNRHFYYGELMRRAAELLRLPKGNNSRKFRRFLEGILVQTTSLAKGSSDPVLVFPALLLDSELDTEIKELSALAQNSLTEFLRAFNNTAVVDDQLMFTKEETYAESADKDASLITHYDLLSGSFTYGVFYGFKNVDLETASQAKLLEMISTVHRIVNLLHAVTENLPRSMASAFSKGPFFVTQEDQEEFHLRQYELEQKRHDLFMANLDKFLSQPRR